MRVIAPLIFGEGKKNEMTVIKCSVVEVTFTRPQKEEEDLY